MAKRVLLSAATTTLRPHVVIRKLEAHSLVHYSQLTDRTLNGRDLVQVHRDDVTFSLETQAEQIGADEVIGFYTMTTGCIPPYGIGVTARGTAIKYKH